MKPRMPHLLAPVLAGWFALSAAAAEPAAVVRLWPGTAPGDTPLAAPEGDSSKPGEGLVAGRPVIRLANVGEPSLTVYRPDPDRANGAAVVVCPGGGYHILAWDLEGTEVCEWLNSIGVTGLLLKYRVPRRADRDPYEAPLQDAQRAIGLARQHAAEWGIDPARIGVLGFSAGGHLAANVSNNAAKRAYPTVDEADALGCRPDFAVLVYPGYLVDRTRDDAVNAGLPVGSHTPPTFLVMSQDDPVRVENVLGYAQALQQAKVPFELHVHPKGGHGYGLRRTELPVTRWPDRAAEWLEAGGWLGKR